MFLIYTLVWLGGCSLRENPAPDLAWQRSRAVTAFAVRQPRSKAPQGVLRAWFPDAPHRVDIEKELFPAAELVRHLDDHARVSWDAFQHDFGAGMGPLNGDAERARQMRGLAKKVYLGIHRVASLQNPVERHEEADHLTRNAYCEAARIPTPGLSSLAWWRDIVRAQAADLDAMGLPVSELTDGRLALDVHAATFDTGSARLSDAARDELSETAANLARLGAVELVVEGHTDPRPIVAPLDRSYATNLELGYARARAVEAVLIAGGVPAERITVTSKAATEPPRGEENPRRVEVVLDACPAG